MYNNYGYNPYGTYTPQRPMSQPIQQPTQMPMNNYIQQPIISGQQTGLQSGLQGKIVDSIETAKNQDIPLDGSTSYFALTDGSMIVTKQLQMDGTSKMVIFRPVEENKDKEKEESKPKYVTESYFSEKIEKLDNSDILNDLLDEMKSIKQEIKESKLKSKDREK